jgi:hypothetical protein
VDNLIELATFNDDNFGIVTEFIDDKYEVVFYKQVDNNFEPLSEEENAILKDKYLGGE